MDPAPNTSLIDLLLRSEKRKKLMLFLMDGPKSICEITDALGFPSTSILPQIKKLKEANLVLQTRKCYRLSDTGWIMAEKMLPLLNTLQVLEENFDFWVDRDLEGIPPFLIRRLGELKHCMVLEPDLSRIYEPHMEFSKNLVASKKIMRFTSYFQPPLIPLHAEVMKQKKPVSFVISRCFFERLVDDYPVELDIFLHSEYSKFFVYPGDPKIVSFTVTDRFVSLYLFEKNGKFDQRFLISFEKSAIKWGEDLFAYYRNSSEEVHEDLVEYLIEKLKNANDARN